MDDEFDYDDDDDETPDQEPASQSPRDLREAAKRARKVAAERDAARRELALVKAGVDTDSKMGQLFARAYDGDLDVEKIKAEWAEIAGPQTSTPTPEPELAPEPAITPDEASSTAARQALANGSPADLPSADPDPRQTAVEAGDAIVAAGGTRDAALAASADALIAAAINGDRRVIVGRND